MSPSSPRKRWQQARSPLNLTARQRIVAAVQRVERPITKRTHGKPAINAKTQGGRIFEVACDCGYVVCAKRGPCAPVSAPAPSPVPAPVGERKRFEVGQRVRTVVKADGLHPSNAAREFVVHEISPDGYEPGYLLCRAHDFSMRAFKAEWLEPLPALPSADPVEGWVPPGWSLNHEYTSETLSFWQHASGVTAWKVQAIPRYSWCKSSRAVREGGSPTLAQACCAALSIELECDDGLWLAFYKGNAFNTGATADAESCARAALEAHARQGGDR